MLPGQRRFCICYAIYSNRGAGELQRQRSCNCEPEQFRYCKPGHRLLQARLYHYAERNSQYLSKPWIFIPQLDLHFNPWRNMLFWHRQPADNNCRDPPYNRAGQFLDKPADDSIPVRWRHHIARSRNTYVSVRICSRNRCYGKPRMGV